MNKDGEYFYVTFKKGEDGKRIGHLVSSEPTHFDDAALMDASRPEKESEVVEGDSQFKAVLRTFIDNIELYRGSVPIFMVGSSGLRRHMASTRILEFCQQNGESESEFPAEDEDVYRIKYANYRQFRKLNDEIRSMSLALDHLPQIMTIGLISVYDNFLSQLLTLIFNLREEIILTSEKQIKFSELSKFNDINEVRASIINKEVESVIRESHHSQFDWMEKNLSTKLRNDLQCWPDFIEICERRNLFTHTGGVVSAQYLLNCKDHKCDIRGISIGQVLLAGPQYFERAVNVVEEIGIKLAYVLWRKFLKIEANKADAELNKVVLELIEKGEYQLAETLGKFGVNIMKTFSGEDRAKRVMIVNYANAIRLQKRETEAKQIINQEDWSATEADFRICVAAVNEDVKAVVGLMYSIGEKGSITREDYRQWPVFRGIRGKVEFASAFEDIFHEKIVTAKTFKQDRNEGEISREQNVFH